MEKKEIIKGAESSAYEIVCAMIDAGFVESEPEGLDWENKISTIIKNKFCS